MSKLRSEGSGEVHSLYAFALRAIGDAVLAGAIADTGALAVLPSEAAEALLDDLAQQLATNDGPSPPLELLRLFFGGRIERLAQMGADDDWVDAAVGSGGIRGLRSLVLRDAKITVHGAAVLGCSLPELEVLELDACRTLAPAGALLLVEPLQSLRRLALRDCGLKLLTVEQCAALRASPLLSEIDLSGNELSAEAALALAQPGGAGLRELRVDESDAADDLAMAAMAQTSLEVIGLASTRVTSEGVQLIALGLGSTLLTLDLRSCKLDAGSISPALPSLTALKEIDLAHCIFSCDDAIAVASVPTLTALDLSESHLHHSYEDIDPLPFWEALCYHPKLRKLRLTNSGVFNWDAPQWRTISARTQRMGHEDDPFNASLNGPFVVERGSHSLRELYATCPSYPITPEENVYLFEHFRRCVMSRLQTVEFTAHGLVSQLIRSPKLERLAIVQNLNPDDEFGSRDDPGGPGHRFVGQDPRTFATFGSSYPSLTDLDLSMSLNDDNIAHLVAMPLRKLRLRNATELTPACLPHLAAIRDLEVCDLTGTSVGRAAQEAALGHEARATRRRMRATSTLGHIRAVQEAAAAAEAAEQPPRRYDADEMRALRSSPLAAAPPKPMPRVAGFVVES